MNGQARLVVIKGDGARQTLADLVMAWARDIATGEPRYILELDEKHRGAKCDCECPSCGLPLTAVNAAKTEFVKRPHFRHPEGAERNECRVLAARVAALRQLQEEGWLQLPRRGMPGKVVGLSGQFYDAWVEMPAQRVHISQVDYRDRAVAVITLDDGRQLRVDLTGTPGDNPNPPTLDGQLAPTIYLSISDPGLAGLEPEELRRRARLLPTEVCWHSHWSDAELAELAQAEARAKAHFYFDDEPAELEFPEEMDPALRRETALHLEVKRILAEEARLAVPGVSVEVEVPAPGGRTLHGRWAEPEVELRLASVQLETRYGRLIPDITCEAFWPDGSPAYLPLLIEVTVTNPIDEERLQRIRATGEATVEIDLSLAGGRVNRDELRRLVVDEVAAKRWLFHPDVDKQRDALLCELAKQAADEQAVIDARAQWLADRKAKAMAAPLAELGAEYLDALVLLFDAGADFSMAALRGSESVAAERGARELVADAVDKLAMRGYPEAGDGNLVGGRGSILSRILSIRLGRLVGYRYENVMGVLNAIRQMSGLHRSTVTIFLIAARAYTPALSAQQQAWFDAWAAEVRESIKAGEATYLRDPAYDRLLALLFPEMATGLAKPFGKVDLVNSTKWDPERQMFVGPKLPERRRAHFLETQPRSDRPASRLLDTNPGQWWLKGRDLEAWKRANPEAAKAWFSGQPNDH